MSQTPTPPPSATADTRVMPERVICADDDIVTRTLFQRLLADRYEVHTCDSGDSLLDAVCADAPELVLLDLNMPGMSGLDTLANLRRLENGAGVPVIIVSSADTEDEIGTALSAGADDFIIKPVRRPELLAKIAAAVKKRRLTELTNRGFAVGTLFNDCYEIVDKVGEGGYSTVYEAVDRNAQPPRTVALKIFDFSDARGRSGAFVSRFLREAYEHSRLDHPNIVRLYDFGQVAGTYFMCLEFLRGRSLRDRMYDDGALPEQDVIFYGLETAKALQYIAEKGMIHRDIKPANIMQTPDGQVKICDFGLARRRDDTTLSVDGEFGGTPLYVAPEYILDDPNIDIRMDIYALGVTLFHAIAGQPPITGNAPLEILRNHLDAAPLVLRNVAPHVRRRLSRLIGCMLEKDPRDRPTIAGVISVLADLLDD